MSATTIIGGTGMDRLETIGTPALPDMDERHRILDDLSAYSHDLWMTIFGDDYNEDGTTRTRAGLRTANSISSGVTNIDGRHTIMLDIDRHVGLSQLDKHWSVLSIDLPPLERPSGMQMADEMIACQALTLSGVASSASVITPGARRLLHFRTRQRVRLLPSSTAGHFHLYIDALVTWPELRSILLAMAALGAIERGYAEASEARGAAFLRLPWVRKDQNSGAAS